MPKLIVLFLLAIFFLTATGCDVYEEGFDIGSATNECEASGGNCEEPTGANLLALSISNSNPATSPCGGSTCVFDIAGLCNEADFAQDIIEYRVYDPSNNSPVLSLQKAFDICNRGKFRLQVNVPQASVVTAKRLEIEIVGKDLQGNEFRNPLAARRDVDVIYVP